jgi:phospho-N-acetylmuramoyl-pentapeptide-transferase
MLMLTLVGIVTMSVLVFGLKMKSSIYVYFLESISIAGILKIIIDIFVLMATTNAVNLTDGVDGLSSSVGIVILTFLMGYAIKYGNIAVAIFDIIVIGAYIIFLLFNWYKAKVFMGDTGSFFLGAVIALSAIATGLEFVLPLIAIIPVVETVSVILQVMYYKKTKKRLFKMAPLHHHFEQSGWKEVKIVRIFTLITILMCLITKFVLNI